MARLNQHVIARQQLELDVPSVLRAPEIQEAVAQKMRDRAMTEVEALFDRLSSPSTVVRLERVEVDLGDLIGADWQEQFSSRLIAQLEDSLTQAMASLQGHAVTPQSGQGNAFEQYLYFLGHGRLPWWGEAPPANWPHPLLQELDAAEWPALVAVLGRSENARYRLIHAVDDATMASLLDRHAGLHQMLRMVTLWRPANLRPSQNSSWRTQFWLAVLDCLSTSGVAMRGPEIMRRLLRLRTAFGAPISSTGDEHGSSPVLPDFPAPWHDWLFVALRDSDMSPSPGADSNMSAAEADAARKHPQLATDPNPGPSGTKPAPGAQSGPAAVFSRSQGDAKPSAEAKPAPQAQPGPAMLQSSNRLDAASPARFPANEGQAESPLQRAEQAVMRSIDPLVSSDEVIYLNGAGCIILHPFLEALFRSNQLLEGRQFRDEVARARAVHLLSLLTFGDEAVPEYELLLPKLLCGLAWEKPLEPVELTDQERASCDRLLIAVLGHWQALKSGSTTWMREQFFLRSAKLEPLEDNWRLTVERRAQDVLLDRLPWGIGIFGLPWMNSMIYVDWTK